MSVEDIVASLRDGNIVCFPTETLYALAVDAYNSEAVKKLYAVKKRAIDKPCAVMLHNVDLVTSYAVVNTEQLLLMKKFIPGPVTFILNKKKDCSLAIGDKIGIRIPRYNKALDILQQFDKPLLSTSANFANEPDSYCFAEIPENIISMVGAYLKDDTVISKISSTVIDITTRPFTVLRYGALKNISL